MNDKIAELIGSKIITTENISFDLIREFAGKSSGIKYKLDYGRAILNSEEELDQYLYSYGPMIKSQWENLLSTLTIFDESISIIDYGCGQGLASMLLLDKFKKGYRNKFSQITLIEPSTLALARANHILSCYCPESKIKAINKNIDNLTEFDLKEDEINTKIHLLSNILDVDSFNHLELLNKIFSNKGVNCILAVSHDRDFKGGERLEQAYKAINEPIFMNWFNIKFSRFEKFRTSNNQPAICFCLVVETYGN